jgi:hypothetical protein
MAKVRHFFIPLVIFAFALLYRGYQASYNHPFWVDEFSTTFQANLMRTYQLNTFLQKEFYVEYHNIVPHFLVALSFQFLGESTFAARLPFILIGSLVPVFIWFVGDNVLKNRPAALAASALATFSYIEITWSRQARGYVLQQVLLLAVIWAYFSLFSAKTKQKFVITLLSLLVGIVLGILTHLTFLLLVAALGVHALWYFRADLKKMITENTMFVSFFVACCGIIFFISLFPLAQFAQFLLSSNLPNNLSYYHSFLWREYGLLIFLTVLGICYGWLQQRRVFSLLMLVFIFYMSFFCFIFEPKVVRYIFIIFPLFFLASGYGLSFIIDSFLLVVPKQSNNLLIKGFGPLVFAFCIAINGDKFSPKPKAFYSVNHDFREIALIDYDQVYKIIEEKGELEKGQTAVIETWADRLAWYVGRDFEAGYFFRWPNESELLKQTQFTTNTNGEKIVLKRNGMRLITSVEDLKKAMEKYPKGFIWIDDTTLPADVLTYVEQNFKKELTLDHYAFDDNPYSIWPGTLYSWGIEQ